MIGSININCTNKCNMSCSYCYRKYQKKQDMNLSNKVDGLEQIKNSKISNIILTGGEPTLSNQLENYVSFFDDKQRTILTNGLERLRNAEVFDNIIISFDGDEITMFNHRNINAEKYLQIIDNINYYLKKRCQVGISTVITKQNVELFDAWIINNPWIKKCNISLILVSDIDNNISMCLDQNDLQKISNGIDNIINSLNYHIRISCNMISKRDYCDIFSNINPERFAPEYNVMTGKFELFNYSFDSLFELEQQYCSILEEIHNKIDKYLLNKDENYLFDPYSVAERVMRDYKADNELCQ